MGDQGRRGDGVSGPRLAVVVGATGTLGGAIADRFVERGLRVIGIGRDEEKLAGLEARGIEPLAADLGSNDSVEQLQAAVREPVKIAVMSAGLPVRGSALTIEPGGLSFGTNIKVDGLVRFVRGLGDHLGEGSRLAALTGFLGVEPTPNEAAPGAINAAVHNLLRQLAELLGPRGTSVHAICPGPVDTDRLRNIAKRVADERDVSVEDVLEDYRSASSLGQLISVGQVAWAAELLLADEASALHGSTLAITGGRLKQIF